MELGADGVELDVHASADARLVVMHDVTLDRTTSGKVRLRPASRFPSSRTFCSSPQSGSRFS